MNEWKEYTFSEFIQINPSVKLPKDKVVSFVEMKDLVDGRRFCIPSSERRNGSGSKFKEYDTLFARITPCLENGKIAQAKGLKDGIGLGSTEFLVFRGKPSISDNNFVYYLSRWEEVRAHAEINLDGTSGRQRVPKECFNDLKLILPTDLAEQRAIASILSSLDDKIDLLHRQNATLEKMAETLFRQWFVEEAKEDWVRTKIGDVLDTVLGGTPSTKKPEYWDGNIPWINSGEVNNFRILQCSRFITELGLKKSNTKLLPVGTTVLAITGATLGQVSLLEIDTCANQSVVGIIPNGTLPKEFIFLWIKMKISEIILSETGGAQPHINKNDINETDIVIPDSDYLNKIKLTIEPLFKKITHNSFQIRTLTALRDTLLPKLMSGEVRVVQD